MFPDDSLLRKALVANALFAGICGVVFVAAAEPLSRLLGQLDPLSFYVIGGVLALFSVGLVRQVRVDTLEPTKAFVATLADLGWVAGSAVLLYTRPDKLSDAGMAAVVGVAVVVLALALTQLVGLRRFARNRRGQTELPSAFVLTRRLDALADAVWNRLAALERIGEFYDGVARVEVDRSGDAPLRTCVDGDGNRWSEEILEVDSRSRNLTLRFVTEAHDFPFPMTDMVGGWRVTDEGDGCELMLWYEYALPGGVLGEFAAALLAPSLRRRMLPVIEEFGRAASVDEQPAATQPLPA